MEGKEAKGKKIGKQLGKLVKIQEAKEKLKEQKMNGK